MDDQNQEKKLTEIITPPLPQNNGNSVQTAATLPSTDPVNTTSAMQVGGKEEVPVLSSAGKQNNGHFHINAKFTLILLLLIACAAAITGFLLG